VAYRTMFSDAEWQTLQFAPLWAFTAVAGADGKIDEAETRILMKEVAEAPLHRGPFTREVMVSLATDLVRVAAAYKADPRAALAGLLEVRTVLSRVESDQAAVFKYAVMAIGKAAAEASGPMFGSKIAAEEQAAWALAAVMLGFDMKESEGAIARL
jgi:hypothetical protein